MRARVPKEQSGGDRSVQRELCVFVPDDSGGPANYLEFPYDWRRDLRAG